MKTKEIIIHSDLAALELNDGTRIPVGEIEARNPSVYDICRIVWTDGRSSWAKGWAVWDGSEHRLTRVGAGAYGDMPVWSWRNWAEFCPQCVGLWNVDAK